LETGNGRHCPKIIWPSHRVFNGYGEYLALDRQTELIVLFRIIEPESSDPDFAFPFDVVGRCSVEIDGQRTEGYLVMGIRACYFFSKNFDKKLYETCLHVVDCCIIEPP